MGGSPHPGGQPQERSIVQAAERPGVATQTRRLREMTAAEFEDVYGCDRFTATIIANRFRHIVSHICNQLRVRSFSPILRDVADLCGILSGPAKLDYAMVAVSETLPLFYGSVPDAVPLVLEEYGVDKLEQGDSLLVNDYYRAGTHLNDVCQIKPMFYKGEPIGAITIRAHMTDMGGLVMGGWETSKQNVYHDGLRLPPMPLFKAGRPVVPTFKLIYANTRLPDMIVPDLETMYHSLELGEQLLCETIDKYGMNAYLGAVRYACDASVESMSEALRRIPDGVYEGEEWFDGDGRGVDDKEYAVRVKITKVGERAEFDFRETSCATPGALNAAWPDIKTSVAMALKFLIDQRNPITSATLRTVDCVVPPDAIINPMPPHACMFYSTVVRVTVWAIMKALNPALGPDAMASCGQGIQAQTECFRPDGTQYPTNVGGGASAPWGATRHADADSGQQVFNANMLYEGGVEASERTNPCVLLRSEYVADSAGPGANRGGAATIRDEMWLAPTRHRFQVLASKRPQAGGGVFGGKAGVFPAGWMWDADVSDEGERPPFFPATLHDDAYRTARPMGGLFDPDTNEHDPSSSKYITIGVHVPAPKGAVVRTLSYSGGGWGDPLERDPERVMRDVRDEYVSIEGAARDYGVVVIGDPTSDPEGLRVDAAATEALRKKLRGA
jgi:N-methylhydantoinase B